MEEVCPDALFLNYSNPMAILSGAMQRYTNIRTVGLCHSVQTCAGELLKLAGETEEGVDYKIAGINHMAWLLELTKNGEDIYPQVKEKVLAITDPHDDMVRVELMRRFGYYVTESSEHSSEYVKKEGESVARLFEFRGKGGDVILKVPKGVRVQRCDLKEQTLEEYPVEKSEEGGRTGTVRLHLRPFEIFTVKLVRENEG